MDIYSYENEKVRFDVGRVVDGVPKSREARERLNDGEVYTVDFVWISPSYSDVYLKEFPGIAFNTPYFINENQEGRRDTLFKEEYKENTNFERFIRRVCPNNSRLRLGLGTNSLSKEQVFSYFVDFSYDKKNIIRIDRKSEKAKNLLQKFGHKHMYKIELVSTYHNLVVFYFWNGTNQFLEFYIDE